MMPGPMESARMLMTEKTPLMIPKDRPDTAGGRGGEGGGREEDSDWSWN